VVPFEWPPRPLLTICSDDAFAAIEFSVEVGPASLAMDELDDTMIIVLAGCCILSVVVIARTFLPW